MVNHTDESEAQIGEAIDLQKLGEHRKAILAIVRNEFGRRSEIYERVECAFAQLATLVARATRGMSLSNHLDFPESVHRRYHRVRPMAVKTPLCDQDRIDAMHAAMIELDGIKHEWSPETHALHIELRPSVKTARLFSRDAGCFEFVRAHEFANAPGGKLPAVIVRATDEAVFVLCFDVAALKDGRIPKPKSNANGADASLNS